MKKKITIVVDILMFAILLAQMLYVFAGNVVHEILGIAFFVCLITHMILKRHWLKSLINSKGKKLPASMWLFHIVTILLILSVITLMLSSLDVSRFLFPDVHFLGSPDLHRYLATAVLALAILHGGLHLRLRSKHKKRRYTLCIPSFLYHEVGQKLRLSAGRGFLRSPNGKEQLGRR